MKQAKRVFGHRVRQGSTGVLIGAIGAFSADTAQADQPLWELGMGAAALRVPHYRGSDQSHDWLLPVPYLVFRGSFLRSDREGTRAVLLDSDRVDLDLSFGATPPANTDDNRARAGMRELGATLEVGPNLNMVLARGTGWKLDLRVPVRAAFTVASHPRTIGWISNPVINLDAQVWGWNIGLQTGPLLGSRRFHGYFYDVAPAEATAIRPAYAAGGGSAGWALTSSASRRVGSWWLAGFVRADTLRGAAFRDSPLVKQDSNLTFGFAASWVFFVSDSRVADSR